MTSSRYSAGAFQPEDAHPAPTYPEYAQLLADAQAAVDADGGLVDPRKLYRVKHLQRSWEWKVAVLGRDGTGTRTVLEMNLLLFADERDLDPPPPQWLVDVRREGEQKDAARAAARAAVDDADQVVSDQAAAATPVKLVVRRNGHARPRNGFPHHLGHFVPDRDVYSGYGPKKRRHLAGRGLCETSERAKPLDLSGGEGGAATCVNCLKYAPQLRAILI